MKTFALVFILAFSMNAYSLEAKEKEAMLKSFRLVQWDNVADAKIDAEKCLVEIKHIGDGSSVTGVHYELAKGVSISPVPETLVGKWAQETVFTLTRGKEQVKYKVLLSDYVPKGTWDAERWKLVWNEEFNDARIDWSVWSKTPRNKSDWNDTMTDSNELYALEDGNLVLYGISNTKHPEDPSPYLTGGIWGRDKRSFSLGRIDIRAKFDCAKGYWPAIWLLPQGNSEPYSGGGEIDIMEHLNFDNFVYQTVHSKYTNLVNKENPKNHVKSFIDTDLYNVYSVEVYPDKLVFSVNDEVSYTYPRIEPKDPGQFPYDRNDYYVILSSQIGGEWVGEVDLKQKTVKMEIDWVRVYQPK